MVDRAGQQIGNYRLIRLLGRGGFAEVYLGEHVELGTLAAVKVLHTPLTSDITEKFLVEARLIASLDHPHIVHVRDFGFEGKEHVPFLVMDYAPNGCLCQRHTRGVPLPLDLILHYVKQVASALQYAHSKRYPDNRRLIHRDIKPENMLLGRNDEVLLTDFGIAVVTHTTDPTSTQDMAGTLPYIAPEQILGNPRRASDQYALGVVVYEWLCGRCPFLGTRTEVADQHLHASPPSLRERMPFLSPEVEQVVFKALAKHPKERFASVQEFALALEQACLSSKLSQEETFPRVLYTYRGHSAPVKAVAWSPDGQRIASAGDDGTMQLWEAATGCNTITYSSHQGMVNTVAWSPDGAYVASGGQDSVVRVWNAITGQTIFAYDKHSASVTAVAWSPGGQFIASAGQDRTIRVWDRNGGEIYWGHTGDVQAVAWSPDGIYIASGSLDWTVRIWNVATKIVVRLYADYTGPINAIAWSPDGRYIAVAGDDKQVQVREAVWSGNMAAMGQIINTYRGHDHYVNAIAWSPAPHGRYIASASSDRTVRIWSAATGRHKFTYRNHTQAVHALAWSPDGKRIASASADHTVQVWQVI